MSGRVWKTDKTKEFIMNNSFIFDAAIERMAKDMVNYSKAWVPRKTGELQDTAEVAKEGIMDYNVWYDRYGDLGYAAVQEHGGEGWNYTTPGTGEQYLKRAGDKIEANALNYLRQAAQQVKVVGT